MSKEVHIINGTGAMGQCDLYPKHSIHVVRIDENGIRWTKGGRDSIYPDIGSVKTDLQMWESKVGGVCLNCENVFTTEGHKEFVVQKDGDVICARCHEKRTKVDRN